MNATVRDVSRIKPETNIAAACAARVASVDPVELFSPMRGSKPAALARCIAIHLVYLRYCSAPETGLQFGRSPGAVRSASDSIMHRCKSPDFARAMKAVHKVYGELMRRHHVGVNLACASLPGWEDRS